MGLSIYSALSRLSGATIGRICDHMMGREHSRHHRIGVGVGVMTTGVLIAKSAAIVHFPLAHVVLDGIGYMIHAAGATPLLEAAFAPFAEPVAPSVIEEAVKALEEAGDA
jgi:hypothetical protein